MKVALVEKHRLPRHKTCGGGMPFVVRDYFPHLDETLFVESETTHMRHSWRFGEAVIHPMTPADQTPLTLWMARRSEFDNALAQYAASRGARLIDGAPVSGLERNGNCWTVTADKFKGTGRFVIGADGANGKTARLSGLHADLLFGLGMEIEYPIDWGAVDFPVSPTMIHLEYGALAGGYAWIFPKGDHLNVGAFRRRTGGIADKKETGRLLKKTVFDFLASLNLSLNPDTVEFHAHPLPLWNPKRKLQSEDATVFLIGDAAGLINPFMGDGILHAIKSGHMVAECLAADPRRYAEQVKQAFASDFAISNFIAGVSAKNARLFYRKGITRPRATRIITELLCEEITYDDFLERAKNRLRAAFLPFGRRSPASKARMPVQ
jgi:flavin-dependent dehydrogenase